MESLPTPSSQLLHVTSLNAGAAFHLSPSHLPVAAEGDLSSYPVQVSQHFNMNAETGMGTCSIPVAVSTAGSYSLSSVTPPATSSGSICLVFCTWSSSEPETCLDVAKCAQPCSSRSGGQKWNSSSQSPSPSAECPKVHPKACRPRSLPGMLCSGRSTVSILLGTLAQDPEWHTTIFNKTNRT